MEQNVITTLISTSGAVIVGLGGMWIATNQTGKRIDDLVRRIERLEDEMKRRMDRLEEEFRTFKEVVNGKLAQIDSDIARLMDKPR